MAKFVNGKANFGTSSPVSSSNSDDEGDFAGDEEQETKPDPLELSSTTRRRFEDISGEYYDESGGEHQPPKKQHRGGRVRDPIWQHFHLIESTRGDNQAIWQCNDCNYSLARPQADRMKKHKIKCIPILRGDRINDEDNEEDTSSNAIPEADETRTKTQKNKTEVPSSTSFANITPSRLGITPSNANSITKQLRRIADSLEESNKLKKLQLGLDPYAPFDGESPLRKT